MHVEKGENKEISEKSCKLPLKVSLIWKFLAWKEFIALNIILANYSEVVNGHFLRHGNLSRKKRKFKKKYFKEKKLNLIC